MRYAETKRCLDCGYILDSLPEPRCPECGRTFDPADPLTYALPPDLLSPRACLRLALLACGAMLVLVVSASLRVVLGEGPLWCGAPLLFIFAYFSAGIAVHDSISGLRYGESCGPPRDRWLALAFSIFALLLLLAGVLLPAVAR